MSDKEKREYLLSRGWIEADDPTPWRWTVKGIPGIYALGNAYELQLLREKEGRRAGKK